MNTKWHQSKTALGSGTVPRNLRGGTSLSRRTVNRLPASLRVPVNSATADYLRSARRAELEAWVAALPDSPRMPAESPSALVRLAVGVARAQTAETRVLHFIAAIAGGAVVFGLLQSAWIVQQWDRVVEAMRLLLAGG